MQEATSLMKEQRLVDLTQQQLRLILLTDQNGFLTATRQRLIRLAQARGVEPQAIEDVIQETLLEAWRCLDRLHEPAGFNLWIDEICRNICRRAMHRRKLDLLRNVPLSRPVFPTGKTHGEEDLTLLAQLPASDETDPFVDLSRQDLVHLLDQSLKLLPQPTRQLVEMCYLLELPRIEVAQRLGITNGTLDVRLLRARRQLQHILHGPLLSEAEAMGLAFNKELAQGWQTTRLWCPLCACHRLQGCFVRLEPEDDPTLHMRCPACSQRHGQDTFHSMGLVHLADLRSFRPAWKRTLQGMTDHILQALEKGQYPCFSCGSLARIQIKSADAATRELFPFWIQISCVQCGRQADASGSMPSVDQLVYWSHPLTRQFLLQHPRTLSEMTELTEYEGNSAICFQLVDKESADQMTGVVHRQNLRILALRRELLQPDRL
jgi:RNA polymerase sigma factor (sigma-70 family)